MHVETCELKKIAMMIWGQRSISVNLHAIVISWLKFYFLFLCVHYATKHKTNKYKPLF